MESTKSGISGERASKINLSGDGDESPVNVPDENLLPCVERSGGKRSGDALDKTETLKRTKDVEMSREEEYGPVWGLKWLQHPGQGSKKIIERWTRGTSDEILTPEEKKPCEETSKKEDPEPEKKPCTCVKMTHPDASEIVNTKRKKPGEERVASKATRVSARLLARTNKQ